MHQRVFPTWAYMHRDGFADVRATCRRTREASVSVARCSYANAESARAAIITHLQHGAVQFGGVLASVAAFLVIVHLGFASATAFLVAFPAKVPASSTTAGATGKSLRARYRNCAPRIARISITLWALRVAMITVSMVDCRTAVPNIQLTEIQGNRNILEEKGSL